MAGSVVKETSIDSTTLVVEKDEEVIALSGTKFTVLKNNAEQGVYLSETHGLVALDLSAVQTIGNRGWGLVYSEDDHIVILTDATAPTAVGPKGDKGDTGDTGPAGPQGPQGIQGDEGPQGLQGIQGVKGDTGDTGPQGIQGVQGDQGIQGIPGPTGPQGIEGLVWKGTWSGATAYAEDDAVYHSGSSYVCIDAHTGQTPPNALYWNYLAQKGAQGEQGLTGPQGPEGPQGPQGLQGDQGIQGIQGPKGDTGDTGPQGSQGLQGDTGATGATGPQGIQGPIGPAGPQGDKGLIWQGVWSGATTYVIDDAISFNGSSYISISDGNLNFSPDSEPTKWELLASKGDQGIQGIQGIQGDKGDTGDQGPQGIQGVPGVQGNDGPQGPQGDPGPTGATGATGATGNPGADGRDIFWISAPWQIGVAYNFTSRLDALEHNGSAYICKVNHTSTVNDEPGIGSSWVSYWDLMAAKGDQGDQGIQGIQGPAGSGVPSGGTTGQVITKLSATDYDADWQDPAGGTNYNYPDNRETWFPGTHQYEAGSLVRSGFGQRDLFYAKNTFTAYSYNQPREGSSWKSHWDQVAGGMCWRGTWVNGNTGDEGDYELQDVVVRNGVIYLCLLSHDADSTSAAPGTGGSWTSYWQVIGNTATAAGATSSGRLIQYIPVNQMYIPDPGGSMNPATTPAPAEIGTSTVRTNVPVSFFDPTTDEYLYFTWTPPYNWDRIYNPWVRMRFYWYPTNTNTGNVYWYGYVRGYDDGDILTSGPSSINGILDAANGTVFDMHRSDFEAYGYMTGVSADYPFLVLAVRRWASSGNDTYTGDAALMGVDLEYYVTDYALP
jgi:hypothetical protein